ncbi:hypothetical protein [Yoonia algicola]|uniref:Uncharacterized protein n=1 Tax=Yoonia algicola TaxID=3137368 RepID=A0AAN0M3U6_9RHOB
MNSEAFLLIGICGAIFLVSLLVSFFLGKGRNKIGLTIMGIFWAGFTGLMVFEMNRASGWDGLGYALVLLLGCAPAGVGGLIGSLAGWVRADHARVSQTTPAAS